MLDPSVLRYIFKEYTNIIPRIFTALVYYQFMETRNLPFHNNTCHGVNLDFIRSLSGCVGEYNLQYCGHLSYHDYHHDYYCYDYLHMDS